MSKFLLGQKVKIKTLADLPADMQTRTYAGMAGMPAEIVDALYSEAKKAMVYKVRLTGAKTIPCMDFPEEALLTVEERRDAQYAHEIEYLDNLVLVRFYKLQDGQKVEIARGHGHIIHAGDLGVAQATSFAFKRIYEHLMGGDSRDAHLS